MPGTRTAPAATAAANARLITFKWIDISGDTTSDSFYIPAAATAANVEALAAAAQLASNASLYAIMDEAQHLSVGDASNALGDVDKSTSLFDTVNITYKNINPDIGTKRFPIRAPIGELFVGPAGEKKDAIDPASTELIAVMGAALTLFGAGWSVVWGKYVEHKEINERIPI